MMMMMMMYFVFIFVFIYICIYLYLYWYYDNRLLPFGAGRRVCVGEVMARNRMFMFVVTLLQRFTFKPEVDGATLPCDPRKFQLGAIIRPHDYKVRAIPRDN